GIVARRICRGDRVARRQVDQLDTPAAQEGIAGDEESVGPLAYKSCEGRIDLADGADVENLDLQPQGASSRFHTSQCRLSIRIMNRVDKHSQTSGGGHQLDAGVPAVFPPPPR